MLPYLIPLGIASAVGIFAARVLVPTHARPKKGTPPALQPDSGVTVTVVDHALQEETEVVLATEEIPLDNRFGNKLLHSEHEFARSASISLQVGRGNRQGATMRSTLMKLLESRTEGEISKNLGIKIGSQISRKVRLKFSTDPGCLVRYRVIWKQHSRRGIFTLGIGSKRVEVPYLVAYGLFHSVESQPGEEVANGHRHSGAGEI